MSLKEDMHAVLMAIAPTAPANDSQVYGGKALIYITFFRYNRVGSLYSEGDEAETDHYFQIDLWEKYGATGDIDDLEAQIETALSGLGFKGFTTQDLYEKETKINHIAIRCNFTEGRL